MDGLIGRGYPAEMSKDCGSTLGRPEPLAVQLKRRIAMNAEASVKMQRMVDILEKNPDIEELLNLTREVGI